MRNRAKCKLCGSIIESFHSTDYMMCKCGEIGVDAGQSMKCYAKDFANFMRVDDEGNEIVVTVKTNPDILTNEQENKIIKDIWNAEVNKKPSRNELIQMLADMSKTIEALPEGALNTYVTHYDLLSFMLLVTAALRADNES